MHFLLLIVLGLILWPIIHHSFKALKGNVICRNCGSIGKSVTISPRSLFLEIVLWCAGLFPGVIYSLWCAHVAYNACGKCHSRDIVPVNSPVGRKLAGDATIDVTPVNKETERR